MSCHDTRTHEELRARLKRAGLRSTSVRIDVLCALHAAAAPVSYDALIDRLGEGRFDAATVYRILADLSEVGVLRRMDLGDHVWRFELVDECRSVPADHPHFFCVACKQATCLPDVQIAPASLPASLGGAQFDVQLTGRCADCRTSAA